MKKNYFSLETVYFLLKNRPKSFDDCISWARIKFEESFVFAIQNILDNYPLDHKTPTGGVFWSGNKRCPKLIKFDFNDSTHKQFIYSASKLYGDVFGIKVPENLNDKYFAEICEKVTLPKYVFKKIVDEKEKKEEEKKN